jgi:hypothetical protein
MSKFRAIFFSESGSCSPSRIIDKANPNVFGGPIGIPSANFGNNSQLSMSYSSLRITEWNALWA